MKKYKLLLVVFLFTLFANAQTSNSFLLNLYAGYAFQDKVEYDNSYAYVKDGFEYGIGLEYFFIDNSSVELKYNRLDTKLPIYGSPLGTQYNAGDDKGALNYILLDYAHYFDIGSNVMPYLGAGAGITILETPQSGSETYFAWEAKAGIKIKTSSPVSINLNAYLQSMAAAVGNSYYWTYYYGPVGVTDYVATYQFGLGATISYDFSK